VKGKREEGPRRKGVRKGSGAGPGSGSSGDAGTELLGPTKKKMRGKGQDGSRTQSGEWPKTTKTFNTSLIGGGKTGGKVLGGSRRGG